jgi:hypothetical protein
MFVSFQYMFRASKCPSSGETTVFMRHLLLVIPPCTLDSHPYRVTSTKYRISTAVSPDDGHTFARKTYKKILRNTLYQVGFIYKIPMMQFFVPSCYFVFSPDIPLCTVFSARNPYPYRYVKRHVSRIFRATCTIRFVCVSVSTVFND